ncbi:hypothetical protein TIFTF001_040384 [Ficus carica]|uniref:Uncharacterized protein n=1 Tax=Ficus carica TaxID=3494 RepID=A0AA87Z0Y6_FICCA|nr:hypothetical protein TIFTF001_040384 [Ficus carica]
MISLLLKWRDRFQEFKAWLILETLNSKNLDKVCINKELCTKCPPNPTPGCTCAPCSAKPRHRSKKFSKKKGIRRNKNFPRRKDRGSSSAKEEALERKKQPSASSTIVKTHFIKNCPRSKSQKMIAHNEVESIFFADEEINDQTLCSLQLSDSDAEASQSNSESEPTNPGEVFHMNVVHMAQKAPIIRIKFIPTKYANPVKVAAFFDTCASYSIMNPDILSPAHWKKKKQFFHVANREVFCT